MRGRVADRRKKTDRPGKGSEDRYWEEWVTWSKWRPVAPLVDPPSDPTKLKSALPEIRALVHVGPFATSALPILYFTQIYFLVSSKTYKKTFTYCKCVPLRLITCYYVNIVLGFTIDTNIYIVFYNTC
jgi:hypothetical protein